MADNNNSSKEEDSTNEKKQETETESEPPFPTNESYLQDWPNLHSQIYFGKGSVANAIKISIHVFEKLQAEPSELSSEHRKYLLTEYLPTITTVLLNRDCIIEARNSQYEIITLALGFLEKFVEFSAPLIGREGYAELTAAAVFVFSEYRTDFYTSTRDLSLKEGSIINPIATTKRYYEYSHYSQKANSLWVKIICSFGEKGLESLVSFLEKANSDTNKVSLEAIKAIGDIFYSIREVLTAPIKSSYFPRFQDGLFKALLSLKESDLRPVKKENFEEIMRGCKAIMESLEETRKKSQHLQACEKFSLDFGLKCLRTDLLEKRLYGMSFIEQVLNFTSHTNHFDPEYSHFTARYLETKVALEWLEKNKIIEELFVVRPHEALIGKAERIVIFLSNNKALTKENLELIWSAIIGKHETIANASIEILYETVRLSTPGMEVFEKIATLPDEKISARIVDLLYELSKNGSELKSNCLDFLFGLCSDHKSGTIKKEVQELALKKVIKASKDIHTSKGEKKSLLSGCFTKIKQRDSVCQTLILFQEVLNSFADDFRYYSSTIDERITLIEEYTEKHKIFDAILEESESMKSKAQETMKERLNTSQNQDITGVNETVLYGIYPHMKQVDTRLSFLSNLIKYGKKVQLSETQIDQLWKIFYQDALSTEEASSALNFFQNQVSSFGPSPTDKIFEKLQQIDAKTFSERGLECFYTYFIDVNKRSKTISEKEETRTLELRGFGFFWSIAISAIDPQAQTKAMNYIIRLFLRLSKDDFPKPFEAANFFIQRCMQSLKEATQSANTTQIEAAIRMLKAFLDATPPPSGLAPHDRGSSLSLSFINKTGAGPEQFSLRAYVNDPVSLLRKAVAAQVAAEPPELKLLVGDAEAGLELTDDKTVGQFNLYNTAVLRVQKLQQDSSGAAASTGKAEKKEKFDPMPDELEKAKNISEMMGYSEVVAWVALKECRFDPDYTATKLMTDESFALRCQEDANKLEVPKPKVQALDAPQDDDASPALILVNSEDHFNALFELLQNDKVDRSSLWNILMKLPTAQNLYKKIENIEERQWPEIFSLASGNVYKLLYNLQVTAQLIESSDGSPEKEQMRLRWCKNFLHQGFGYVFDVLTQSGIETKYQTDPAWQSALTVLLTIINFFIKGDRTTPAQPAKDVLRHSGDTLQKTVDYPALVRLLLELIPSICQGSDLSAFEPAIFLFLTALKSRPGTLLKVFYAYPRALDFIRSTLTAVQPEVRKLAEKAFQELCALPSPLPPLQGQQPHPHRFFLDNLLKIEAKENSDCFYNLLTHLIRESCQGKEGGSPENFRGLVDALVKDIKSLPPETNPEEPNYLLIGKIQLLTALVSSDLKIRVDVGSPQAHNMTTEVFGFIFSAVDQKTARNVITTETKCRSKESRKAALLLLGALGKNCPENLRSLVTFLLPFHSVARQKEEDVSWNNPQILSKSNTNYVGLKNLGSICYVNSLMQQFFMTPTMRRDILCVPTEKKEDNLMYCIQDMFGTLFFSERKFHNPDPFCKSWRDWEGQPIKINEQQDVLEFFNVLCDHLEKLTKGTKQEKLLDQTFTGTFSQMIESQECTHTSETKEKFYAISVDIKGKSQLEEALENMVMGERLEGESAFSCSSCNRKVAAIKTTSIDERSPLLIIHLKRFEYSVERQNFRKYNDKLAFPTELNIEPYTKQGLDKKHKGTLSLKKPAPDMMYNLVGVLVHTGEANMGHYYSFIKERNKGDSRKDHWFRFDDTSVSKFDLKNLEEEAFGGSTIQYTHYGQYTQSREVAKTKSAYMLFYERADEQHIPSLTDIRGEIAQSSSSQHFSDIEKENYQLTIDRQLFDPDYSSFMKELLDAPVFAPVTALTPADNDPYYPTIQAATFFVYETIMRVRDEKTLREWTNRLKGYYSKHTPACRWFLNLIINERSVWIKYMLLETFDLYVRECFAELVCVVLSNASAAESKDKVYERVGIVENLSAHLPSKMPTMVIGMEGCVSGQFAQYLLTLLPLTRTNWRRFSQYFSVLLHYAKLGHEERDLLLKQGLIQLLINYYMGEYSPENKIESKEMVQIYSESVKKRTEPAPQLTEFFDLLALVVRTAYTEGQKQSQTVAHSAASGADKHNTPMSPQDEKLLLNTSFFVSCIKEDYNIGAWGPIAKHLSWEHKTQSLFWMKRFADLVCRADWVSYQPSFSLYKSLLRVRDSLEVWRSMLAVNWTKGSCGLLDIIFHYAPNYPRFTRVAVQLFLEVVQENPHAAAIAYHSRDGWQTRLRELIKDHDELKLDLNTFLAGKMDTVYHRGIDYTSQPSHTLDPTADENKLPINKY